jgi:hypothetical protein
LCYAGFDVYIWTFFNLLAQYIVFYGKNNRFFRQKKTLKKWLSRCLFFKVWVFLTGVFDSKKSALFAIPAALFASEKKH